MQGDGCLSLFLTHLFGAMLAVYVGIRVRKTGRAQFNPGYMEKAVMMNLFFFFK